jgi:hypothetical protein
MIFGRDGKLLRVVKVARRKLTPAEVAAFKAGKAKTARPRSTSRPEAG